MTGDRHPSSNARDEQRAQTRLALGAMLVPLFFVTLFALCIIGTYHRPQPNGIKVGVVGPSAATAQLRAGLEQAAGSAFAISAEPSVAGAERAVRDRDLDAAFVPTADPGRPATVIVAGGGGRLVATAAETLARSVTARQGTQLAIRDVRPLAAGDEIGIGVFMFMIVCTIGGYLAVTILGTVAPALEPARRYPIIVGIAVLIPTVVYLIAGVGFGTYSGSAGTILAFLGIAALYTLVVGLGTRLFQVLFGPLGLFLSLAVFVFLNIPSLGATYTTTMLNPFWRFINEFWIGAQAVSAIRSLLYFDGSGVGADILGLVVWAGVIIGLLLLPASRRRERESDRVPVAERFAPPAGQVVGER